MRWAVLMMMYVSLGASFASADEGSTLEEVRRYRERHQVDILREFAEILAIPNVASDPANIRRVATDLRDRFERRGVTMELLEVDGAPPLVYGRIDVLGATRTLGIYLHYDGQPVDEDEWTHSPWEATLYDGIMEDGARPVSFPEPEDELDPEWRIYARSSGDDKAPAIALLTALSALRQENITPTSNIVFCFEGEEEAGSGHLGEAMRKHRDRLEADLWLICDGPVHQSRRPQLVFGVRGVVGMEITVYGANRSLHSGHYGNWAPNPGMMLSQLLASMKDENGDVIIDGFDDSTDPLGEAERSALASVPDVDGDLRRELGLARTEGTGESLAQRLLRPSLNVRGLRSANVGDKARNVIPSEATAAIDIRLVKGNDPTEMLDRVEAHARAQGYHIVRDTPDLSTRRSHPRIAKITRGGGYRAARTRLDHPLVPLLAEAARAAADEPVILLPSLGGSLPLYLFEEILEAPVVIVPIANHDNNQHAPNENLRLANLWYGIDLMTSLLTLPARPD